MFNKLQIIVINVIEIYTFVYIYIYNSSYFLSKNGLDILHIKDKLTHFIMYTPMNNIINVNKISFTLFITLFILKFSCNYKIYLLEQMSTNVFIIFIFFLM